jgi:hypothetical protein
VNYDGMLFSTVSKKVMADNPKKKKADGKRISKQPWEQEYQKRKNQGRTGSKKKTSAGKS